MLAGRVPEYLRVAFGHEGSAERAIRAWASHDDGAAAVLRRVDAARIAYVRDPRSVANDPGGRASAVRVPVRVERQVIDAATDCPGECIFVEDDPVVVVPATESV